MRKIILSILLSVTIIASLSLPVSAISNPDSIAFGSGISSTYAVFTNVYETGDMLFIAEGLVVYAVTPTDYTADQAFIFEVMDGTTNATMLSTPLAAFGDRPIGIYQTAAQVTANNLTSGTAYKIRITGNPLIFSSTTNNTITTTLSAGDYFDDTSMVAGFTPLRNFCINTIASHMQTYDGVTTYKTVVLGTTYLTTTGANLFLAGIPGLDTLEPSIFLYGNQALVIATHNGTGAYGASLNATAAWGGSSINNGLAALSSWTGMGTSNGGHIFLFIIGTMLALALGAKAHSPLLIIIVIAILPLFGSLLGLMNLAAALTISLIIIIIGALLLARSVLT